MLKFAQVLRLSLLGCGASVAQEITKPDGKPADMNKPVKVFILLGHSNKLGFGRVGPKETKGSIEYMIKEKGKYGFLVECYRRN